LISLIQTAEGALSETHDILQRMRELAVQSSNDTNTNGDRAELQKELDQLANALNDISNDTEFNTQKLLDGDFKATFHVGANKDQNLEISIAKMNAEELEVSGVRDVELTEATETIKVGEQEFEDTTVYKNDAGEVVAIKASDDKVYNLADVEIEEDTLVKKTDAEEISANNDGKFTTEVQGGINISNQSDANTAIETIQGAIDNVSAERSKLGAVQNRLDHTINNLGASAENLTAAESRIRDVDMAKEMMEFTKNNILSQAAQSMLAQSQQMPQAVLQLLG